ncbi:putative multi-sensor hybrid histidine kinase [Magnetofaba australis IT-1]|uniref:Sensory/regulatory protein RpfC n=1 Tax=Magnetofaba australis IT-1 TaxID=1434232 RepID=A0A1Y2K4R4_9PROT|nr:putative multi-sensor hybrid histidine kinase [Magnetofaba australis IT-1]
MLLILFFLNARSVSDAEHARFISRHSQLVERVGRLNEALLKTRFHMAAHYDLLTDASADLERFSRRYADLYKDAWGEGFTRAWTVYDTLLQGQLQRVEAFKTHNAIVANSRAHFPDIVDEALDYFANRGDDDLMESLLRELMAELLIYDATTIGANRLDAGELLVRLQREADAGGPASVKALEPVRRHVTLLLTHGQTVDKLFRQLTDGAMGYALDGCMAQFRKRYQALRQAAEIYNRATWMAAVVMLMLVAMVTLRLRAAREAHRETMQQLDFQKRALDEHAIVSIADANGNITYANEKFLQVSEYTLEELLGRNHRVVKSERHSDEFFTAMWTTISSGRVWHGEIMNRSKSGRHYWVSSTIVPFVGADGKPFQYVSIRTDITRRKEAENKLTSQSHFLATITSSMGEGVYALDAEGDCTFLNPTAERLLGWRFLEMKGRNLHEAAHYQDSVGEPLSYEACAIRQSILQGRTFRSEDESFTDRAGRLFPVSVVSTPLRERGKIVGSVAVFSDITRRKEQEQELLKAKQEAEWATQAKSEFLANMSHEIRTPMNAIIGMSHLAQKTELTAKQRDYVDKIHGAANHLLQIINDILDFSKIEAGKLDIEMIPFRLDELLENLSALVTLKAREKGLEFLIDCDSELPETMVGDPLRLNQVLLNLINNAIKFTQQGEVVLSLRPVDLNSERLVAQFDVRDSGIGMSAEQMARLFQSFSQADSSITRNYGGTGLGLAISKQLCEMLGGDIWVESVEGEGSTFHFTMVFGLLEQQESPARRLRRSIEAGLELLVVDDSATAREILHAIADSLSFRVSEVESGDAALKLIAQRDAAGQPFRAVLVDWKMPVMDGAEVARRIASMTLRESPAVIMVSAEDLSELRSALEGVKVDAMLAKPVTASTLLDAALDAFGRRAPQTPEWGAGALTPVDASGSALRGQRILLVEDNAVNQQIAQELLEDVGCVVTLANNGQEGVDAVAAHEFDVVLMDVQMPVMDGYEATRRIRANSAYAQLPILAMTANVMVGDRERSMEVGMNDHVSKPIDPSRLYAAIARALKLEPDTANKPAPTTQGEAPRDPLLDAGFDGVDIAKGLSGMGGKGRLYRTVLSRFADDHAQDLSDLTQRLRDGERVAAERLAHTLKGICGGISHGRLFELCAQLEARIAQGDPLEALEGTIAQAQGEMTPLVASIREFLATERAEQGESEEAEPAEVFDAVAFGKRLEALKTALDSRNPKKSKAAAVELEKMALPDALHEPVSEALADLKRYRFRQALEKLHAIEAPSAPSAEG